MQNNRLAPLAHPVTLMSLLVILINAWLLQPGNPSWVSGKLGDAAWMVVAPILIATAFSFLASDRDRRILGLAGILITGVSFGLLKTIPALNHVALQAYFDLFHIPLKLALDPSDILVLPFLGLAWLVWNSHFQWYRRKWFQAGALSLIFLALVADSPAPQSLGFTCLMEKDKRIYAFQESLYKDYFSGSQSIIRLYYSTDGGLTWTRDDQALDTKKEHCIPQVSWPLGSSTVSGKEYDFLPGRGIYTSYDGGQTLELKQKVVQVTSTYQDLSTGNVIFTAGREGVIVETPDGKWQTTLQATDY